MQETMRGILSGLWGVARTRTRRMKMKNHEFTIIASGLNPNAEDFENRFFEAGCGDATISFQKGISFWNFLAKRRHFRAR
jgi:hypothetical protein